MVNAMPGELSTVATIRGFRGLLSEVDGSVVGTLGRRLVRFSPPFQRPEPLALLPSRCWRTLGRSRLVHRLLRLEVYRLVRTPSGAEIATSREGILRRAPGSPRFEVAATNARRNRPLSLCADRDGRVYFGEYFGNAERESVGIFVSEDDGATWRECHRFEAGAIRHVHGLIYDSFRDRIWVMTGDYGDEARIGMATPGFGEFHVIARGSQQTRACDGVCQPSGLVYATDTPLEPNHVIVLDPETGRLEPVATIPSSVLFMGESCGGVFLSTIVEPSDVNTTNSIHVWFSPDGRHWSEVWSAPRDRWSIRYFQYPTASFARGPRQCPYAFMSLRGTSDGDGDCLVVKPT